ncbi:MAG: tetratricopeptide repeat protein [Dehalococcoidia bacterium]
MATDASIPQAARDRLRAALGLHERGDIEEALAEARAALELAPGYADAHGYIGSTLVQRKGRFAEGLAELERAREAAPDDPSVHYTLGWCCEFVAHAVARRPQPGLDADELYRQAEASLRRCLELEPEGKMKDDAQDLLASIIREDVG